MNTYKLKTVNTIDNTVRTGSIEAMSIVEALQYVNKDYRVVSIIKMKRVEELDTSIYHAMTELTVCDYTKKVHNDIIAKYNNILMICPFNYEYSFYAYGINYTGNRVCVHAHDPEALSHIAYDEWDLDDLMVLNGEETTLREFNSLQVFMSERSCSWSSLVTARMLDDRKEADKNHTMT